MNSHSTSPSTGSGHGSGQAANNKPARLKLLQQPATAPQFQPYGPPLAVGAPVQRKTPKSEFLKWLEKNSTVGPFDPPKGKTKC